MEIGLALNPSIIGKGLGVEFVTKGIEFGIEKYDYKEEYIKLNVDEIKDIKEQFEQRGFNVKIGG